MWTVLAHQQNASPPRCAYKLCTYDRRQSTYRRKLKDNEESRSLHGRKTSILLFTLNANPNQSQPEASSLVAVLVKTLGRCAVTYILCYLIFHVMCRLPSVVGACRILYKHPGGMISVRLCRAWLPAASRYHVMFKPVHYVTRLHYVGRVATHRYTTCHLLWKLLRIASIIDYREYQF